MKVNCFKKNILVGFEELKDTSPNGIELFMAKNKLDYITGKNFPIAIKKGFNVYISTTFLMTNRTE